MNSPALYAVPADPSPPLAARMLYALSLFSWLKAHPDSTRDQFLEMIERAEARAAQIGNWRESGGSV